MEGALMHITPTGVRSVSELIGRRFAQKRRPTPHRPCNRDFDTPGAGKESGASAGIESAGRLADSSA
jgi:hypothetical protein